MVEFEWDDAKDVANQRKHGVAFQEAATSFYDPLGLEMPDEVHSKDEERWLRIVSSRVAKARERKQYEG